MYVKLNLSMKNDNKEFRLVQNLTMGEGDFNQFTPLRNQLVLAAENIGREEISSPGLTPTMSKDMNEQLKVPHKVLDVVDRANKKICLTLLRYIGDEPKKSNAQVQLIARRKMDEKFHQYVFVNYKLGEFLFLLIVMNSEKDKVITKFPNCNVL